MTIPLTDRAQGVYAIAVTPFHPDGRVDRDSVARVTEFYLRCGVNGLTILGMVDYLLARLARHDARARL